MIWMDYKIDYQIQRKKFVRQKDVIKIKVMITDESQYYGKLNYIICKQCGEIKILEAGHSAYHCY